MVRIRTLNTKKPPEGWDEVAPQLEEFQQQMRDAVNEPHEGKRRNEATWGITKIHYERSRYIYELYYKKKAISKELYDYLLQEKWGDANLIAKWKKPGYEYLCSLQAIDKRGTNFNTTAICRVPLHLRKPGPQGPSVVTGCISCASTEAGRLGGPIWWDSPRPADLVGWAKAGCPTETKKGKKRKADEDDELEARAAALRKGAGGGRAKEAAELEALTEALRGHEDARGGGGFAEYARDDGPDANAQQAGQEDDDMASDVTGTLEAHGDEPLAAPTSQAGGAEAAGQPQGEEARGGFATPSPGGDSDEESGEGEGGETGAVDAAE